MESIIDMDDLYNRQVKLDLKIPDQVVVIGVGGIGSWVALDFALVGVKNMKIFDPDTLELSNLNRTPYTISQVGLPKIFAMQSLILERRTDINLELFQDTFQNTNEDVYLNADIIVDCSDALIVKDYLHDIYNGKYVKLGYDGESITIDPDLKSKVWADEMEGEGYRTVPSYLVPPQIVAAYVVDCILHNRDIKAATKNINDIWNGI